MPIDHVPATTTPTAWKNKANEIIDALNLAVTDIDAIEDGFTATGELVAPSLKASGKTGATTSPGILGGGTNTGAAPTTGAHVVGELVIGHDGKLWVCTTAGTPGTWVQAGAGGRLLSMASTQYAAEPGVMILPLTAETDVAFEVQAPDNEAGQRSVFGVEIEEAGYSTARLVAENAAADGEAHIFVTADALSDGDPGSQIEVVAEDGAAYGKVLIATEIAAASILLDFSGAKFLSVEVDTDGAHLNRGAEDMGFNGATPIAKPTVTGSRGGNAALASLLTALANLGLITDSSS